MTAPAKFPAGGISSQEIQARAAALAAAMAPHAEEAERIRKMPDAAVEAVLNSGLMPLLRPARYGGFEQDWTTLSKCLSPLGRLSGSLTWCTAFLFQHQWVLSYFPIEAQDAVYGAHPDPKIVTSFAPGGKVVREDGGYRVTGEWSFGSGGDHCDWAITGAMIPAAEAGPPTFAFFLFKPDQFRIRDVWESSGLRGSGSNNIVVEDAFVPDSFVVNAADAYAGNFPSKGKVSDNPIYNHGLGVQFQFGLAAPFLATADGLLDSFIGFMGGKSEVFTGSTKVASPLFQLRVGEAAAQLSTARLVLNSLNDRLIAGELGAPDSGADFLCGMGVITRSGLAAGDSLISMLGARGLGENNLAGRQWRDIHAMATHAGLQTDPFFQDYGRNLLGVPAPGR